MDYSCTVYRRDATPEYIKEKNSFISDANLLKDACDCGMDQKCANLCRERCAELLSEKYDLYKEIISRGIADNNFMSKDLRVETYNFLQGSYRIALPTMQVFTLDQLFDVCRFLRDSSAQIMQKTV